jgi:hypothetical protein
MCNAPMVPSSYYDNMNRSTTMTSTAMEQLDKDRALHADLRSMSGLASVAFVGGRAHLYGIKQPSRSRVHHQNHGRHPHARWSMTVLPPHF